MAQPTSSKLTRRQAEILGMLWRGMTPREIARELDLAIQWVYDCRRRLIARGAKVPPLPSKTEASA